MFQATILYALWRLAQGRDLTWDRNLQALHVMYIPALLKRVLGLNDAGHHMKILAIAASQMATYNDATGLPSR